LSTSSSRRRKPPTVSPFASCSTTTPTAPTAATPKGRRLFTVDTRFAVYMDGEGSEPTYVMEGRDALAPVFADLNRYEATTHFNGQSTVQIDRNRATGESYTIAHHVYTEDVRREFRFIMSIKRGVSIDTTIMLNVLGRADAGRAARWAPRLSPE
jgi:hypothetical protein